MYLPHQDDLVALVLDRKINKQLGISMKLGIYIVILLIMPMVDSLALLLATLAAGRVLVIDLSTFDRFLYLSAAVVELFLCANLKDLHATVVFLVGIDIGSAYDRTHYTEESKQFLALSQLDLALRNIDAQKEINLVSVNLDT